MAYQEESQELTDWVGSGPGGMQDVAARQVNNVMNQYYRERRLIVSDEQDLNKAFQELARLIIGKNKSLEMGKAYLSFWEMDESIPEIDSSCYKIEKAAEIQAQVNIITSALSRYYDLTEWLLNVSRTTKTLQDINFSSATDPNPPTVLDPQARAPRDFWASVVDAISIKRPEKRAAERSLGILEGKFQQLQNAMVMWTKWDKQRLYKIRTLAGENDSVAMATWISADLRDLFDVQRLILSTVTLAYRIEMSRQLDRMAQTASSMTAANMGAQAQTAAMTAATMSQMQGSRQQA